MKNTFPDIYISTNTVKGIFGGWGVNQTTDDSEWLYMQHYSAELFNRIKRYSGRKSLAFM